MDAIYQHTRNVTTKSLQSGMDAANTCAIITVSILLKGKAKRTDLLDIMLLTTIANLKKTKAIA
jgi:hypothetical protein